MRQKRKAYRTSGEGREGHEVQEGHERHDSMSKEG